MKNIVITITLLLSITAMSCTSKSGNRARANIIHPVQSHTTKAVVIDSAVSRTTNGHKHKIKLIDQGVVAFANLANLYENGDTIQVTKSNLITD